MERKQSITRGSCKVRGFEHFLGQAMEWQGIMFEATWISCGQSLHSVPANNKKHGRKVYISVINMLYDYAMKAYSCILYVNSL